MVPIFGYGNLTESGATSESLLKDLKSIVFKHKTLPLRIDKFFIIHVESIIGSMNLLSTSAQSKVDLSDFERETKGSICEKLVSKMHKKRTIPKTQDETNTYMHYKYSK